MSDTKLGWWAISGERLLELLGRAHEGADPDLLYAEEYANGTQSKEPPSDLYKHAYAVWMAFLADEETHELQEALRALSAFMYEQTVEEER